MAHQILPNLHQVVVPLPGSPLKEINSWVFTADDRTLVIDTGMRRPECRAALEEGFAEIGVDLERTDFVSTHLHADHCGLIPELLRPGRRAWMGAGDAEAMRREFSWSADSDMGRYLGRSGFPADELEASFSNHPAAKFGSGAQVDYLPLHEGDVLEIGDYRLEVIDTPGHTLGHVSLYDRERKLFIAGDHVLGDITPNIQAWSDDHDPLEQFMSSLRKVASLEVELCLPGHRSLIRDFQGRVQELQDHHVERAEEAKTVLGASERNAYQTAADMHWDIRAAGWDDFPVMQRWFATGETIAHLRWLEERGEVRRRDTDDEILYSVAS